MVVDIKKILIKKRVAQLIDDLVKLTGSLVSIKNADGELIYGDKVHDSAANYHALQISGEVQCWLVANKKVDIIIPLVTHIINSEIEKVRLAAETLDRYREINLFYDISEKIATSVDLKEISDFVLEKARRIIKCTSAAVLLFNENKAALECVSKFGTDCAWQAMIKYYSEYGEMVFAKSEIINDVSSDKRFGESCDKIKSIMYIPLKFIEHPLGVISLTNSGDHVYNAGDLKLLRSLALQASSVIKNAQLFEDLRDSFAETVHALIETVEKMEHGSEGHSRRVSECAVEIGKQLGLSRKDLLLLKITALLHDIGKIKTNESNYKEHPANSVKVVEHVKYLKPIIPGIKHHHENFNGTGFPDGLKGAEIPLNSRIIAVADAFEHSSSEFGLNVSRSLEDVLKSANTLYDSDVVMALFKAYGKKI